MAAAAVKYVPDRQGSHVLSWSHATTIRICIVITAYSVTLRQASAWVSSSVCCCFLKKMHYKRNKFCPQEGASHPNPPHASCHILICTDGYICCSSRRSDVRPGWCNLPQRWDFPAELQASMCMHKWRDWLRTNLCQQHTAALPWLPVPATYPDPWQVLRGMGVWPDPTRRLLPVRIDWLVNRQVNFFSF